MKTREQLAEAYAGKPMPGIYGYQKIASEAYLAGFDKALELMQVEPKDFYGLFWGLQGPQHFQEVMAKHVNELIKKKLGES